MVTDKGDYLEYYGGAVKSCPVEDKEQVDFASWVRHWHPDVIFWHTVNEGKKTARTAQRDAEAGLLKGVSDNVFVFYGSFFAAIELKRTGKTQASPVSKDQKDFLRRVRENGGFAAVAYGFEQCKIAFLDAKSEAEKRTK